MLSVYVSLVTSPHRGGLCCGVVCVVKVFFFLFWEVICIIAVIVRCQWSAAGLLWTSWRALWSLAAAHSTSHPFIVPFIYLLLCVRQKFKFWNVCLQKEKREVCWFWQQRFCARLFPVSPWFIKESWWGRLGMEVCRARIDRHRLYSTDRQILGIGGLIPTSSNVIWFVGGLLPTTWQ